jgi:hypothetical protein
MLLTTIPIQFAPCDLCVYTTTRSVDEKDIFTDLAINRISIK